MAKQQDYTEYSSTLVEIWQASISGLSDSLIQALSLDVPGGERLSPTEEMSGDPTLKYVVEEAQKHRKRGLPLPVFLGLFKHYRDSYFDLLESKGGFLEDRESCFAGVSRFFDRAEIAICSDWLAVAGDRRIGELQACNMAMTNEKNRFLTLFESLVTPVFLLDDALNVEALNRSAVEYFGPAKAEAAMNQPLREVVPWLAGALDDACAKTDGECLLDVNGVTALGYRHFKVSVAHMSDVSDKFTGLTVVLDDITRLVEATEELEGERNRVARYLDVIGSMLLGLDASGNITLINKAGKVLLGREDEDLIGRNWIDLAVPVEERASVHSYFSSIVEGRTSDEEERVNHVKPRTGEVRLIAWKNRLLKNEKGHVVGILCAGNDITARVKAERLLQEREATYRALFENNHAVMLLVDPRCGDIRDANPAASEFYGYSLKALRTMNMAEISVLSENETYQEMIKARVQKRSYFLFRHRLASGEVRDVEVYSGPVMIQGRQLLYSLVHDVTRRTRLERELERMATTDALTGADNRHQFFYRAESELRRASRYGRPLTFLMLDIDYFKDINDSYGHQAGDKVLKALVKMVRKELREIDIFGRLGGEEFAAVLPETSVEAGQMVATRLCRSAAELSVRDGAECEIGFTVSIGVAGISAGGESVEEALRRADEALYRAKEQGRNRVESA
ncbi:diguanylate cyclase [Pseudodesulfovibrio sp.]|uniref:sensor domain-containing diguanylate cyclase n=1 Tax=unclassified Pseudodesulfovibrio TaxID=2661612 RepID=UPI003B001385